VLNMVARHSFPVILQSPINCGVIAMVGGLVLVPVVSLLTPKMKNDNVEKMFECYNQEVVVSKKKSLGN